MIRTFLTTTLLFAAFVSYSTPGTDSIPGVRKVMDVVIYEDARFHSAFPSVVKRSDGEVIVAFRRAPDRSIFGEKRTNHVDPNSYLMKITSKDGITWNNDPSLLYAHPFGGSQDPCMLQLRDGTILCASYGWAFVRPDGVPNLKAPIFEAGPGVVFLGGYVLRSTDGGRNWQGPYYPPHIEPELNNSATGEPLTLTTEGPCMKARMERSTGWWPRRIPIHRGRRHRIIC